MTRADKSKYDHDSSSSGSSLIRLFVVIRHSSAVLVDKNTGLRPGNRYGARALFHRASASNTAPIGRGRHAGKAAKCSMAKCRCSTQSGKRDRRPDAIFDGFCARRSGCRFNSEAVDAGVALVVCITEDTVMDMMRSKHSCLARNRD